MSEQDISESPDIRFVGVSKWFGDVVAVDKIDLSVERGAFFSFLGPSACSGFIWRVSDSEELVEVTHRR